MLHISIKSALISDLALTTMAPRELRLFQALSSSLSYCHEPYLRFLRERDRMKDMRRLPAAHGGTAALILWHMQPSGQISSSRLC